MNAKHEIDRLLEESGAVLVRQNKHLVYRLPNGRNFVAPKTPSDPVRGAKNGLSDLRRALELPRESAGQPQETMPMEQHTKPIQQEPGSWTPVSPQQDARVQLQESIRLRIDAMIAREESIQERLLGEAQAVERRVHMLKALLPFSDDPTIEQALRSILPAIEPPAPAPRAVAAPPEPPQVISEPVQVTRQLVYAATQTFDGSFTVNDVMDLMTGARKIEGRERARVRQAIAQAMISLHDRGELIKEQEHHGRQQTVWKKAGPNGAGVGKRA
jgi:hypothetical protein